MTCPSCDERFERKKEYQVYCSSGCRISAWYVRNRKSKTDFGEKGRNRWRSMTEAEFRRRFVDVVYG